MNYNHDSVPLRMKNNLFVSYHELAGRGLLSAVLQRPEQQLSRLAVGLEILSITGEVHMQDCRRMLVELEVFVL